MGGIRGLLIAIWFCDSGMIKGVNLSIQSIKPLCTTSFKKSLKGHYSPHKQSLYCFTSSLSLSLSLSHCMIGTQFMMLLFWGCATVAFCAPVVDTFQSNIPTVGQQFITKNIAYAAATHYPATKKISSVAAAAAEPRSLLDFKSSPKERAGGGLVAASIEDFKKKMPSDWEKTIKNYTPLVSSKNTIPKKSLLTAAIVSEKGK